jgi:FkbM family methyltransferase
MSSELAMIGMLPDILAGLADPLRIIEIGCNDGYHTGLIADWLRSTGRPWQYTAVEPDARHDPHIDGVDVRRVAIAATAGRATLWRSGGGYVGSSSLHQPMPALLDHYPRMTFDRVEVEAVTLDGLCDWPRVSFIWADVQGCIGDMISGGGRVLGVTDYMFFEYELSQLYSGQWLLADVLEALPGWEIVRDFGGDILLRNPHVLTER